MEDCYEISVSLKLIDLKNIFWIEKKVIYNFFLSFILSLEQTFNLKILKKKNHIFYYIKHKNTS